MSSEENQTLLPKVVSEDGAVNELSTESRKYRENIGSNGLTVKIGTALVLACIVLVAIATHIPVRHELKAVELNLYSDQEERGNAAGPDIKSKKLDNEHGADGEIYCDEQGYGECLNRVLGICTEHGPCVSVPSMEPTGTPTLAPSNIYIEDNCDPHYPPCAEWFLGMCTKHYHCHEVKEPCEDNEDDDAAAHTRNGECDPNNPPCVPGETFMGICWKYQDCSEDLESNSTTPESEDDSEDKKISSGNDDVNKDGPSVTKPKDDNPKRSNTTSPASDESGNDERNPIEPKVDEPGRKNNTTPVESGDEPQIDTSKDSNGTKSKDSGVGHTGAEDLDGDDFFDFKWMDLNITIPFLGDLTSAPTMEPTQIHACDPLNPPCARYEVGVCVEYQTCFGIHSTPHNTTKEQFNDDEGYTFEPTHMPVPDPTFRPSEFPTSTPTTTMPTPAGFTFEPTLSMMPTVAETSHPTTTLYCDPQNPPCDNYFFGVCLGVHYCMGTHQPTPSPTTTPGVSDST